MAVAAVTVVVAEAEFWRLLLNSPLMTALFVIVALPEPAAAAVGVTTIVMVLVRVRRPGCPAAASSTPPDGVTPPVAETNVTSAGSVSVTTASGSVERPAVGRPDRVRQIAAGVDVVGRARHPDREVAHRRGIDRRHHRGGRVVGCRPDRMCCW